MQATATTLENSQETAPVNSRNKVVVASLIGTASTVGPGSLVMRGDRVPTNAVWQGNPIEPWER